MAQIVRNLQNNICKFQVIQPFLIDRGIAKLCPQNVTGDCTGGITVAFVVDSRGNRFREIIRVTKAAVQCNRQGFVADPPFTEPMNIIEIAV